MHTLAMLLSLYTLAKRLPFAAFRGILRPFARLLVSGGDWATQMIDPDNT